MVARSRRQNLRRFLAKIRFFRLFRYTSSLDCSMESFGIEPPFSGFTFLYSLYSLMCSRIASSESKRASAIAVIDQPLSNKQYGLDPISYSSVSFVPVLYFKLCAFSIV